MKKLKIFCIQHVPFEGPAIIRDWALRKGHEFTTLNLYSNDEFPDIGNLDWLVIMGGPMSVHEHEPYPWIKKEIEFIRRAIENSKVVLGICLGAQLIAKALGVQVSRGEHPEIGWFPVRINRHAAQKTGFGFLPEEITPFHWHQETFDIPPGAMHLASSALFPNQAFLYRDRVLALQFHFEMDLNAIQEIILHSGAEPSPEEYVQRAGVILENKQHISNNNELMRRILDKLEAI
ncbi:MAG: type 1 glutamine amidotransferase [Bacteroidales bacterium]|nr:type 1 glutamine amidotransferase [Bacteroidales bacterium]